MGAAFLNLAAPDVGARASDVWALSEAKSRGYVVKPETLADLTEWTSGPKDPAGKPILYVHRSPTPTVEKKTWTRPLLLWSVSVVEVLVGLVIALFALKGCGWVALYLWRALVRLGGG